MPVVQERDQLRIRVVATSSRSRGAFAAHQFAPHDADAIDE